jgi:tRNA-2-methylthio-N6-dimethylallyladenosine synthase
MNVADSNLIASHLGNKGIQATEEIKDADFVIVNTCTVRQMAEHKAMTLLGELKHRFQSSKPSRVIVVGCAAQQWGESIRVRYPFIDFVLGAKDIEQFPTVFDNCFNNLPHASEVLTPYPSPLTTASVSSFVTIMRGCDNYCSYCIVPYVRGHEKSRPADEIASEIKGLVRNGVKEVTLLGQNVNSYQGQDQVKDFPDLLKEINEISGLERIRFMTSHPKDLSDKLIGALASLGKMCEHVHLPLQSGSDNILNLMNRKYTARKYADIIRMLREAVPGISITTDVLVGFPGETKEEFGETLALINEAEFDFLFAFKYSTRPGTVSAKLPDSVTREEKEDRLAEVLALQNMISLKKNAKLVGTVCEVLVDEAREGLFVGNTRTNKKVFFSSMDDVLNKTIKVKITDSKLNSLKGIVVDA